MMRSFIFIVIFLMTSANVFAQEELVPVVSLGALNKITAKLETINVGRNETVKFGTLEISMRACSSNPPEETPESVAFLEITDLGHVGEPTKIFSGWMFASSPAVSPLEHAVYDVWVTDCKMVDPSASSDKE
ncbi:MAG: DUF2155 domain-containing protein [Kordiimonadaceae bacterium]|jgi:hypothetical protein|nr:DUF2155 domain-containing protein [Kordiimonadaceae bacterium]